MIHQFRGNSKPGIDFAQRRHAGDFGSGASSLRSSLFLFFDLLPSSPFCFLLPPLSVPALFVLHWLHFLSVGLIFFHPLSLRSGFVVPIPLHHF